MHPAGRRDQDGAAVETLSRQTGRLYMVERTRKNPAGGAFWKSSHAIALYGTIGLFGVAYLVLWSPLPFVTAGWGSGEISPAAYNDPFRVRARMADGLKVGGDLHGKTRAEVVALLGEPAPTSYFAEYDLVYLLGYSRGLLSLDSEWLVARLGEDGRVSEVDVVED